MSLASSPALLPALSSCHITEPALLRLGHGERKRERSEGLKSPTRPRGRETGSGEPICTGRNIERWKGHTVRGRLQLEMPPHRYGGLLPGPGRRIRAAERAGRHWQRRARYARRGNSKGVNSVVSESCLTSRDMLFLII